jgi:hypothetical protein
MELLRDEAQVEARFGSFRDVLILTQVEAYFSPFGDSVSVGTR